jgi:Kef-type K+ transport system membrane component KefB
LLEERAARIILAAAVIDDVLGLLVLALVSAMARGSVNVIELAITAVLAITFTLAVALLGTRAMKRIARVHKKMAVAAEAEYALAITLLFALSLLSVYAGVAAIIGAFLAGMALSETVDHRVHELTNGVTELLVPFFLVGVGLHLDITAFNNLSNIALGLIILVAAVLSKLIGCGLGALPLGRADAFRIGAGMVPRGEVGMVVAQIGLGLGVVAQHVYGIIVFMSVVTTLVAPPMLKVAFRGVEGKPTGEVEPMRIG